MKLASWAVILGGVLGALPARAAITYDNVSSSNTSTAGTSLSWSHTIGSGRYRLLTVEIAIEDASNTDCVVSSVTYNGASLTQVTSANALSTAVYQCVSLWYGLETGLPAGGAYTVAITTAAQVDQINAGAISLAGAEQVAPEANNTGSCTTCSDAISTSVTTLTPNAWLVAAVGSGQPGTFTPTGSGQVERFDTSAASSAGAGSTSPVASVGSAAASWTFASSNRLVQVVAAFAPKRRVMVIGRVDVR